MAFDHGLATRTADLLLGLGERTIRRKNIFGRRGFLAGRSTFVIVWGNGLPVKTRREEYDASWPARAHALRA